MTFLKFTHKVNKMSLKTCNKCAWFQFMGPVKFLCVSIAFTKRQKLPVNEHLDPCL
jgi:hypothetical protein